MPAHVHEQRQPDVPHSMKCENSSTIDAMQLDLDDLALLWITPRSKRRGELSMLRAAVCINILILDASGLIAIHPVCKLHSGTHAVLHGRAHTS